MNVPLTAVVAGVVWGVWIRYQFVRWSDAARVLCDRQVDDLKQMSFDSLAQRAGEAHDVRREVVDGHSFLIGWQADWPGQMAVLDHDRPPGALLQGVSEDRPRRNEVEVRGFVDFIYPLILTNRLHVGVAFHLTRRRETGDADRWAI
jgi:hypothetical protein